jgi:hypothetical protein
MYMFFELRRLQMIVNKMVFFYKMFALHCHAFLKTKSLY